MEYFADVRVPGPVRYDQALPAVIVTASPDRPERIGVARQVGILEDRLALWRLKIDEVPLPGHWVIIDRRFVSDAERLAPP